MNLHHFSEFALVVRRLRPYLEPERSRLAAVDRFQAVVEFGPDGRLVAANAKALELYGYSDDGMDGLEHRALIAPEERDGAVYKQLCQDLAAGRPASPGRTAAIRSVARRGALGLIHAHAQCVRPTAHRGAGLR